MNIKSVSDLVPIAAWGLNLACPVVPAAVWSALINAVISGDVTLEHIQQFMKDHNIKIYSAPSDYPNAPQEPQSTSNINPS